MESPAVYSGECAAAESHAIYDRIEAALKEDVRHATITIHVDISTGVELLAVRGASIKLFYDGRFGDTIQENAAGAKATVPF